VVLGVALALLSSAGSGRAQVSGSVSIVSDYRYRGISLSDDRPAAQLGLTYDAPRGEYVGEFLSTARAGRYDSAGLHSISYAGYAVRTAEGLVVEAGADYALLTSTSRYRYGEIFVGGTLNDVSARLFFAPHYLGASRAVYADVSTSRPVTERVRVIAHVGALISEANQALGTGSGTTFDAQVGAAARWEGLDVRLSWIGLSRSGGAYAIVGSDRRHTVVLALSHAL